MTATSCASRRRSGSRSRLRAAATGCASGKGSRAPSRSSASRSRSRARSGPLRRARAKERARSARRGSTACRSSTAAELLGVAHIGSTARDDLLRRGEAGVRRCGRARRARGRRRHLEQSRLIEVLSEAPAWIAIVGVPEHEYEFVNPPYASLFEGAELVRREVRAGDLGPRSSPRWRRRGRKGSVVQVPELPVPRTPGKACATRGSRSSRSGTRAGRSIES